MASGIFSISACPQTSRSWQTMGNQGFPARNSYGNNLPMGNTVFSNGANNCSKKAETVSTMKSEEMRTFLRNLKQTSIQKDNPYAVTSKDKVNGFLELSGSPDSEEDETVPKTTQYNYNEVANKIQQAKTSVGAGQALISAKRKVLEVKRKIASGEGDPEELQLALTHARRMEIVAGRKKRHLEMEEMIVTTQRRDEMLDKMEEAASDMKNAMVDAAGEEIAKQEDGIFKDREEMLDDITKEIGESGAAVSDEMMSELNEMIAEFGEEELKALEESMEQFENLEVLDPHMSKEDLEDLKRKHRNAENKAIVKANMDYLKEMIKQTVQKGGSIPGMGGGLFRSPEMPSAGVPVGIETAAVSAANVSMPSIDVQV